MDANARMRRKADGGRSLQGVPGTYRRDELNDKTADYCCDVKNNEFALTNTFFGTFKGRVSRPTTGSGEAGRTTSSAKTSFSHIGTKS